MKIGFFGFVSLALSCAPAWAAIENCELAPFVVGQSEVTLPNMLGAWLGWRAGEITVRAELLDPLRNDPHAPPSQDRNLVILFHGLKGAGETLLDSATFFAWQRAWQKKGLTPPLILVPSLQDFWFVLQALSDSPHRLLPGAFIDPNTLWNALHQMENRLIPQGSRARVLVGGSMGAANAFHMARAKPRQISRLIIYSLPDKTDYDSEVALAAEHDLPALPWNQIDQGAASFHELQQMMQKMAQEFKVAAFTRFLFPTFPFWYAYSPWQVSHHPGFGAAHDGFKKVEIYLSSGDADRFGYFRSNELLARRLQRLDFKLEWDPLPGIHHGGPYNTGRIAELMASMPPTAND